MIDGKAIEIARTLVEHAGLTVQAHPEHENHDDGGPISDQYKRLVKLWRDACALLCTLDPQDGFRYVTGAWNPDNDRPQDDDIDDDEIDDEQLADEYFD